MSEYSIEKYALIHKEENSEGAHYNARRVKTKLNKLLATLYNKIHAGDVFLVCSMLKKITGDHSLHSSKSECETVQKIDSVFNSAERKIKYLCRGISIY